MVIFRSKDAEYMANLKEAVLDGVANRSRSEKRLAWQLVQRKVIIDDLHQLAVEKLEATEPVHMGSGYLVPDLLVLTSKSLEFSKEAKSIVTAIIKAAELEHSTYYTGQYKTNQVFKKDIMNHMDILDMEIAVIKPKAILVFGSFTELELHKVSTLYGIPAIATLPISSILQAEDEEIIKEKKAQIWNDVKQIKKVLLA